MSNAFTIQIFYPNGDPESMRVVTERGWTGKVRYVARDYWTECIAKYGDEFTIPGVYVLVGREDEENDDIQTIYIGQTENLAQRVESHLEEQKKNFEYIVCVSGADFYGSDFRWMESDLIARAKEIDRCTLTNSASPNKPQISEPERVDIKRFVEKIVQIFPIVGVNAFTKSKSVTPATSGAALQISEEQPRNLKRAGSLAGITELRNQAISAFQIDKNVKLFQRSKATFHDESRLTRVCCLISREHDNERYWFTVRRLEFLETAKHGYIILGMEGQSKVLCLPTTFFDTIKGKLHPALYRDTRKIRGWHLWIKVSNEKFALQIPKADNVDVTEHTFNIT